MSCRARITAIAQRLAGVASEQASGGLRKGHSFELALHSRDEIGLFEQQLGARLPEEYVRLLTETGSGAGPYYGILAPGKVLAEIESLNETLKREGCKPAVASGRFPFTQADANEICAHSTIQKLSVGRAVWLADGCIPVCYQGCTFYSALVITGELRETVWSVNDDGAMAQWIPGIRPPGLLGAGSFVSGRFVRGFVPRELPPLAKPPKLLEWYESWLERLETDLEDYADFQARKQDP